MNFAIWCVIFTFLNCLDLVTTHAGMHNLPADEMQKKEMNPFMSGIIANRPLSWAIKLAMGGVIVAVSVLARKSDPEEALLVIVALSIALVLTIINNVHATWATKHHRLSLGRLLTEKLHFSKTLAYFCLVGSILGLSFVIASSLY